MKKLILSIFILTISLSSCSRVDFGDINRDPGVPFEGNIDALLRGAMGNYATNGGRVYYSNPTLYAQYQAQTVYTQEQRYVQYKGSFYAYYVNQLMPLKEVANTTEDIRGNTANMRAIAELVSVMITKRVTDTYGDIPYFDALQTSTNITPGYTPQKDIYLDLITRAKAARDMFDDNAFVPDANTDLYYGGDINKWRKFANSLILALSLQLSNTSEATLAKAAYQEALGNAYGLLEDSADNMVFTPDVAGNLPNPISRSRAADFNVTKEMTDALKGNNPETWGPQLADPKNVTSNHTLDYRLYAFTQNGSDGLPYGYESYPQYADDMNDHLDSQDSPFTLFSAAYTWLNRAEGVALTWNTVDDFDDALTKGIEESYKQFFAPFSAADQAAALAYATGTYAPARVADAANVGQAQVVGEEKWFALFPDGFAAWAEQRRTGWPALHPAPDAVNGGVIPHRMLYPDNEKNVNPEGWAQGVQGLVPQEDLNTSKIWWEQ
jgi:hypothetical protein